MPISPITWTLYLLGVNMAVFLAIMLVLFTFVWFILWMLSIWLRAALAWRHKI